MTHATNDNDDLKLNADGSEAVDETDLAVRSTPTEMISIDQSTGIDVSGLPDEEAAELKRKWAEAQITIAQESHRAINQVRSLGANLDTLTDSVSRANDEDVYTTVEHTQETENTRTTTIMGNTDRAAQGKISNWAKGGQDWNRYYIVAGIIAATLVAIAVANSL